MNPDEAFDYFVSIAPQTQAAIQVLESAGLVSPRDHKFLTLLCQTLEQNKGASGTPLSNPVPLDGTPKPGG